MSDETTEPDQPRGRVGRALFLVVVMTALVIIAIAGGGLGPLLIVTPLLGFFGLRLAALLAETQYPDPVWRGAMRTMLLASAWGYLVGGILASPDLVGLPWFGMGATLVLLLVGAAKAQGDLRRSGYSSFLPILVVASIATVGLLLSFASESLLRTEFYYVLSSLLSLAHLIGVLLVFPRAQPTEETRVTRTNTSPWVLLAIPLGAYLVFRFTLAQRIPYGPIVEWFVIASAFSLATMVLARHLGVVSTRGSMPPETHVLHEQRIGALPSPEARRVHGSVERFVLTGEGKGELVTELKQVLEDHKVPLAEYGSALQAIRGHKARKGEQWGLTATGRRVIAQNRTRRLALIEKCERMVSERLRIGPKKSEKVAKPAPNPFVDDSGRPLVRA